MKSLLPYIIAIAVAGAAILGCARQARRSDWRHPAQVCASDAECPSGACAIALGASSGTCAPSAPGGDANADSDGGTPASAPTIQPSSSDIHL